VLPLCPPIARVMAWVKPFAAFKRNVSVAYAWEPVLVKAVRKPVVSGRVVMRDFISEPITMKRGLTGAKPEAVCRWAFEVVGAEPDDELVDLFPGSGAVTRAWDCTEGRAGMSKFEPVWLPEDRALNDRASMTLLRHYSLCQRSAFFYQRYKGEAETPEMARGKAGHLAVERAIRAAIEQGEPSIPGELVKVIANEALTEIHVPFEEHDRVREGVWRWSTETAIDPGAVVALETLFAFDVDGFQVRCRIDLAELLDGGARAAVRDWKFAVGGVPGYEEIARRRPDGSLAAKNFQLVLYGLALAFGVPVREEECPECCGGLPRPPMPGSDDTGA
jgi:hypothetical protein